MNEIVLMDELTTQMQLVTMGNIAQNPTFQETDDVHYGWKWGVVDGAHVMNFVWRFIQTLHLSMFRWASCVLLQACFVLVRDALMATRARKAHHEHGQQTEMP